MNFVFPHSLSLSAQGDKLLVPMPLPSIIAVCTNLFLLHQRAVTIGMWNSYSGLLERVKTLLEMGLISINDKDAVSSLALEHAFHPLAHVILTHHVL